MKAKENVERGSKENIVGARGEKWEEARRCPSMGENGGKYGRKALGAQVHTITLHLEVEGFWD